MFQSLVTTTPVYLPTHPSKALSQQQDYDAMKRHGSWAESTVEERKLWPSSDLISGSRSTRSSIATPHGVANFSKDEMFHRKSLFAMFGIERLPPVAHPLLLMYVLIYPSHEHFFPSIYSCLSVVWNMRKAVIVFLSMNYSTQAFHLSVLHAFAHLKNLTAFIFLFSSRCYSSFLANAKYLSTNGNE